MRYGFIVLPEERLLSYSSLYDEGELGTIFVEVEFPVPSQPNKIQATLYYKRNSAKTNFTTERLLRKRFPKSFAMNDSGEEYTKLCKKLTAYTQ